MVSLHDAINAFDLCSRMIRKAKRVNRTVSLSEEGKFGGSGGAAASTAAATGARMMKNSRKSRSGLGRGLPKKGEGTYVMHHRAFQLLC